MCEEFMMDRSDRHSIETLKDILSGNAAVVKIKNSKPAVLKPVPWIFSSKDPNFNYVNTMEKPWPARLHHYEVKVYTEWNDDFIL